MHGDPFRWSWFTSRDGTHTLPVMADLRERIEMARDDSVTTGPMERRWLTGPEPFRRRAPEHKGEAMTPSTDHRPARAAMTAAVTLVTLAVLAACAAGPNTAAASGPDAAGFWLGLWHGFISPWTFLVSLFSHSVSIYEVHNSGGWYDFGFLVGVSAFFSGPAGGRSARRRSRRRAG